MATIFCEFSSIFLPGIESSFSKFSFLISLHSFVSFLPFLLLLLQPSSFSPHPLLIFLLLFIFSYWKYVFIQYIQIIISPPSILPFFLYLIFVYLWFYSNTVIPFEFIKLLFNIYFYKKISTSALVLSNIFIVLISYLKEKYT